MIEININPKRDLIFDDKVREQCKSCKRYGRKATCPPYVNSVEYYKKLLTSYKHAILYYHKFEIDDDKNWFTLGKLSSLYMYRYIFKMRKTLLEQGHYFVIAFGSGSCKLCNKCEIPCRQPNISLMPLEATGLNIVKMLERKRVNIKYPVKKYFYRVGCLFYD